MAQTILNHRKLDMSRVSWEAGPESPTSSIVSTESAGRVPRRGSVGALSAHKPQFLIETSVASFKRRSETRWRDRKSQWTTEGNSVDSPSSRTTPKSPAAPSEWVLDYNFVKR